MMYRETFNGHLSALVTPMPSGMTMVLLEQPNGRVSAGDLLSIAKHVHPQNYPILLAGENLQIPDCDDSSLQLLFSAFSCQSTHGYIR